jgi:hypothetical protein
MESLVTKKAKAHDTLDLPCYWPNNKQMTQRYRPRAVKVRGGFAFFISDFISWRELWQFHSPERKLLLKVYQAEEWLFCFPNEL